MLEVHVDDSLLSDPTINHPPVPRDWKARLVASLYQPAQPVHLIQHVKFAF